MIESIQEIILSRLDLPNTLYVRKKGDLLLLNYKPVVQYDNLWGPFEIVSRGLIINRITGEIVARPFDKFFNWGENGRITGAKITNVYEKIDGSLGIHYRDNKKILVSTRGSFESDQALWATEHLNLRHDIRNLPTKWTLLFEIVYPENRVVVDYNGWEGLALLAIRNRLNGNYLSSEAVWSVAKEFGFRTPQRYSFSRPEEIMEQAKKLPPNNEGWVAEFADGTRFKFKGSEYLKLHRIITGMTFKKVLEHHKEGTLEQVRDLIPDEMDKDFVMWTNIIDNTISITLKRIEDAYENAPKATRKEYATWIQKNVHSLSKYMFTIYDNKDVLPLIYKFAFKKL